jgi:hypothetical protein
MSTGSISDALTRVSAIEQQLQQLNTGAMLDSALGVSSSSSGSASTSTSDSTAGASTGTDFADELASAAGTDASGDTATDSSAASTDGLMSNASGGVGLITATPTSSIALTGQASSRLTSGQQQFAATLSADTGLSPTVVSAWLLAEESGSAAQTRESQSNNDWLNVGYTDSGTYGASDSVWSDPTTAANATAAWLQGQDSVSGYGTASSAIQSILSSVGQSPATQIQAIRASGWSSSGYPSLDALYSQIASV